MSISVHSCFLRGQNQNHDRMNFIIIAVVSYDMVVRSSPSAIWKQIEASEIALQTQDDIFIIHLVVEKMNLNEIALYSEQTYYGFYFYMKKSSCALTWDEDALFQIGNLMNMLVNCRLLLVLLS